MLRIILAFFFVVLGMSMVPRAKAETASSEADPQSIWSQIYIRFDGGIGAHHRPDVVEWRGGTPAVVHDDWQEQELSSSWMGALGIGLELSHSLRADITMDYRTGAQLHAELRPWDGNNSDFDFEVTNTVLLANLYLDFDREASVSPYIGIGVGIARNEVHDGVLDATSTPRQLLPGDPRHEMAAALMGGAAISIADGLRLDTGYRLLYLGEVRAGDWINGDGYLIPSDPRFSAMVAHEWRLGLRWELSGE